MRAIGIAGGSCLMLAACVMLGACMDHTPMAERKSPSAPASSFAGPAPLGASLDPAVGNAADFLRCAQSANVTLISAHRGRPSLDDPANISTSFDKVWSGVPALMEVDVRTSADGRLVLLHDETLDRETDCSGPLEERTFDELQSCTVDGAAAPVMTLEAALDWARGRTILQLDVKPSTRYEDVAEAVSDANAQDRVIVITYSPGAAKRLAQVSSDLPISVPARDETDLDILIEGGVREENIIVWLGTQSVEKAFVERLDARGIPSIFGTLGPRGRSIDSEIAATGNEARYRQIADLGVDVIATDRPVEAGLAIGTSMPPSCPVDRL
jgi:glycerophosphoryl diester phosphodiesterase